MVAFFAILFVMFLLFFTANLFGFGIKRDKYHEPDLIDDSMDDVEGCILGFIKLLLILLVLSIIFFALFGRFL